MMPSTHLTSRQTHKGFSLQERKDIFRFGIVLIQNTAKAPKKPKTCLRGQRRERLSWRSWSRNKILEIQEENPHKSVLAEATKGQAGTPSGQTMGLAQLSNPAESGSTDILQYWT